MDITVRNIYDADITMTEDEFEELNRSLESLYEYSSKHGVLDKYNYLWELKDKLVAAARG